MFEEHSEIIITFAEGVVDVEEFKDDFELPDDFELEQSSSQINEQIQ